MPDNEYANQSPQSRVEEILEAIINETDYDQPAQSRVEYLLKQILGLLSGKADLDENGLIPTSEIPPEAFEYMIDVADDNARFALTTDDVQKGDIVRVISTGIMYIVVDVTHLYTEAGYKPFAAGVAAKAIGDEDGNNIKSTYQTKIDSTHKLSADLVDDTSTTHKFATAAELQQIETNKTNILTKQDTLVVGTNLDNTPTENSTNPITSGGVYSTVGNIDSALSGLIMSLEPKTITANGTYDPTDDGVDGYNLVTVNVGGSVSKSDVNFYDYDGTCRYSYTAAEFAELTAMPANPTHTGLTAQGWNWSLSDAKTYVASYGKLNIGQIYITSDGKTRLYIRLEEGRLKPYLGS